MHVHLLHFKQIHKDGGLQHQGLEKLCSTPVKFGTEPPTLWTLALLSALLQITRSRYGLLSC